MWWMPSEWEDCQSGYQPWMKHSELNSIPWFPLSETFTKKTGVYNSEYDHVAAWHVLNPPFLMSRQLTRLSVAQDNTCKNRCLRNVAKQQKPPLGLSNEPSFATFLCVKSFNNCPTSKLKIFCEISKTLLSFSQGVVGGVVAWRVTAVDQCFTHPWSES